MMDRIFEWIDRVRGRVVLLWLFGLVGLIVIMVYMQNRENAAKHEAYLADLGAKWRAAGYTAGQCEFIITLANRPGISINATPDAATMAAIHAATQ
jgi:hypothetical protein